MRGVRFTGDGSAMPSHAHHPPPQQCWSPPLAVNLALANDHSITIAERCALRSATLHEAQANCERAGLSKCGGVTRDAGIVCRFGLHAPRHDGVL